ncbi:hypothetical protein [Fodinicurvata sp. EGI_FJ10296]|uniref:hypothetical protein n=1 Tax=Fodinicurvata sp. EGI_FJ10296 TaxID=3231908 RepID=UPI003452BB6B
MAITYRFFGILCLAVAISSPVAAQDLLDSYVAVIGQQDRFNSSGVALGEPAQILTQDRANFHRFGIRQSGDTQDRTFATPQDRAQLAGLLANGSADPAAVRAILGEREIPILVEVFGTSGRATSLRISIASDQQSPRDQPPQLLTEAQPQLPGGAVQAPVTDVTVGNNTGTDVTVGNNTGTDVTVGNNTGTDVTVGNENATAVVEGNEAVQAALFGWALGQFPELASSQRYHWNSWQIDFAPDAPQAPERPGSGPEYEAFLRAISDHYRDLPAPSRIALEFPASLYSSEGRGLVLSTVGTKIDGVHALTAINLNWNRMGANFRWMSSRPFFLPLPDQFSRPDLERGNAVRDRLVVRVLLTMSNPIADVRGGALRGISADGQIESATLARRTERRVDGQFVPEPDRILASWSGAEDSAIPSGGPGPTGPEGMVSVFGGGISAGRYVPEWDVNSFQGRAVGASTGLLGTGSLTRTIETALGFGAILAAGQERPFSPEAAQIMRRHVLTERETYELFPVEFLTEPDNMNELERRSVLADAQPGLRAVVSARMPVLPLPVRDVARATLLDYDFTLQGFPLRGQNGSWMPRDPLTGREVEGLVPAFLPMSETEAIELLSQLERRTEMARTLFVAIDYTLTDAAVRARGSGPILPEELGFVRLISRIDGVTVFADPEMTVPIAVVVEPAAEDEAGPNLLPEELYATTGKSLLGAMGRLPGGRDLVSEVVGDLREVARAPEGQRARLNASLTDEVIASARDDYWVGAWWQLEAYDEAAGGYPVKSVSFDPVAHNQDISGIRAPLLVGEQSFGYEVVRIDPAERDTFEAYLDLESAASRDGMELASHARVRPVAAAEDDHEPVLVISAPIELMLGTTTGSGWPLTDDDRFMIAAPPELGPANGTTPDILPPDVLMLDHEGLDLLAVSLAPEAHDDTAYTRMLVERLLKERSLAGEPENAELPVSVEWGRFFDNPSLPLTEPELARLLPVFRDWTRARAANLPSQVAIPLGFGQFMHPETGCHGLSQIISNAIGSRRVAAYDNVTSLMADAAIPDEALRFGGNWPPRAGPDRVWISQGRPSIGTPATCGYVPRQAEPRRIITELSNAGYADALVRIRAQPTLQPSVRFTSATYIAEIESAAFSPITPAERDGAGLVGVVTLSTTPIAATGHQRENSDEVRYFDRLEPEDWAVPVATPPQALDVVGLTLGMPLEDFLATVRERLPGAVLFEPERPAEGLFGTAVGLLQPDTNEAIVGVYAAGIDAQPIIGIMRRLDLTPEQATPAGLRRSLESKYGPPSLDEEDRYMLWGLLPPGEDQGDFCGGMSTVSSDSSRDAPRLSPSDIERLERDSRALRPGFWYELGWPKDRNGLPSYQMQDPDRCGPVVTATIVDRDQEGPALVVWLFDRKLAEIQRTAAPDEPGEAEEADIDL